MLVLAMSSVSLYGCNKNDEAAAEAAEGGEQVSDPSALDNAVAEALKKAVCQKVVADTMVGGATLTKFLGTSAWYAPGASCAVMVKSILLDEKKVFPCCCYLDGEYGQSDLCIGVPAVIGKRGCEKVLTYDLTSDEKAAFEKSAAAVKGVNNVLYESNILKR